MTFSNSLFAMNKGALLQWGVGSPSEMSENQNIKLKGPQVNCTTKKHQGNRILN